MSEKKWSDTVVGWFIVKDDDSAQNSQSEADLTADELIAKYASQTPLSADGTSAGGRSAETRLQNFPQTHCGIPDRER